MNHPIPYANSSVHRTQVNNDERILPVIPFLTGLAIAPFIYGALQPGGYYPYPPPPPYYYPYSYYPGYHHPYYPGHY